MKKNLLVAFVLATLIFTACKKEDKIEISTLNVSMQMPKILEEKKPVLKEAVITARNINTGNKTTKKTTNLHFPEIELEDGMYNLEITGEVEYDTKSANGEKAVRKTGKVRGTKDNVKITGGKIDLDLPLYFHVANEGFVISEIFFSGTKTPEEKPYMGGDLFIEVYNNSNQVLYADGLYLAETSTLMQTVMKLDRLTPDFRSHTVAVDILYRIPGTGKQYPVQPGKTLLICDVGINHKLNNKNSIDLSKADFEWFDGVQTDDVDVPEVPNLEKIIQNQVGSWNPNRLGNNSFIIFRLEKGLTPEKFAKNYALNFCHYFLGSNPPFKMEEKAWGIPNDKILDAVQCSTPSSYEWNIFHPSLDLSWTHSGDNQGYNGHSVKRKVERVHNGRKILQDTNDSAFDFIPTAKPSPGEIE